MASCRARAAVHHDHASMRRQRRRPMPCGRCMARQCAFTAGIQRSARIVRCCRRAGRAATPQLRLAVSGGNIYALFVSTHYPSDVTADGGGPVYYQQQVLATVSRSDFGSGF